MPRGEIVAFLQMLDSAQKTGIDRPALTKGIYCLMAGGNFADGVIAALGRIQGADVFLTFDRKARRLIGGLGIPVAGPDQFDT